MKTKSLAKTLLLNLIGITLSVAPPALAALYYFPVWIAKGGEYVLSGITLLLIALAVNADAFGLVELLSY